MKKYCLISLVIILVLVVALTVIFNPFNNDNNDEPTYPTPTIEPSSVQSPEPTDQSIEGENKRPEWPVELDPARFDMPLEEWIEQNRIIPDPLPIFDPQGLVLLNDEQAQGMLQSEFVPSFRYVWYGSRFPLEELVGEEAFRAWVGPLSWIDRSDRLDGLWVDEPTEIFDLRFIKYFRISREVFEEGLALLRFWDEKFDNDTSTEARELPNADIIYTFDNDIINEYYRRR